MTDVIAWGLLSLATLLLVWGLTRPRNYQGCDQGRDE